MSPELKESLVDYYDRMVQESIDLKHKVYNKDMRDHLMGKREEVRFIDDYASYIVINGEVFNGWQQAADYLGVSIQKLMRNYYKRSGLYDIEVLKTKDKPKRR